ncbi:hypothetical protein MAPG_07178 [Magnaporthiopsis poae ATCC 64411]|uniref:Uncharacterized protein n=1 Tax=Magnaporthiopsis poae (strain ATCC 64411 / 73-15) TaxID=644358 RepID=A0A0C4E3Z6_MAGP6|nr:hypothetical protein MAPG_07178 [Magnaporthiopsis poae ATCC 64411]
MSVQWRMIGLNNSVRAEYATYRHKHHFALVRSTPRGKNIRYFEYHGNPWDLGSGMANLRSALGASSGNGLCSGNNPSES